MRAWCLPWVHSRRQENDFLVREVIRVAAVRKDSGRAAWARLVRLQHAISRGNGDHLHNSALQAVAEDVSVKVSFWVSFKFSLYLIYLLPDLLTAEGIAEREKYLFLRATKALVLELECKV